MPRAKEDLPRAVLGTRAIGSWALECPLRRRRTRTDRVCDAKTLVRWVSPASQFASRVWQVDTWPTYHSQITYCQRALEKSGSKCEQNCYA